MKTKELKSRNYWTLMLILLCTWLWLVNESKGQGYVAIAFDPNIAVGNSMLNEPGLNYKVAFGYGGKRLNIYKQFEQYKAIDFKRWTMHVEYIVWKSKLTSTINIGYGRIYRGFDEWESWSAGGKVLYRFKHVTPFIEYSVDHRPELPGDNRNHLQNKGRFQNIRSVYFGVSCNFKVLFKSEQL